MMRGCFAGVLLLAFAGASVASADVGGVAPPPTSPAGWLPALMAYAKDPLHNARALRAYRGADPSTLPPAIVLALGDARMRAGQRHAAKELLTLVTEIAPTEVWTPIARLGLAWLALLGDDVELARAQEADLRRMPPLAAMAQVTIALTESSVDVPTAVARLDAFVADEASAGPLRATGRWAAALATWWDGDVDEAAVRFRQLAHAPDAGPFADDARYATAIAQWARGDTAGAREALTALAQETTDAPEGRTSRSRLVMARGAVLRDGLARLRRTPLLSIESQLSVVLDGNGPALARAVLPLLDGPPPAAEELRGPTSRSAAVVEHPVDDVDAPSIVTPASSAPAAPRHRDAAPAAGPRDHPSGWRVSWVLLVLAAFVGAFVFLRSRGQAAGITRRRPGWPSGSTH